MLWPFARNPLNRAHSMSPASTLSVRRTQTAVGRLVKSWMTFLKISFDCADMCGIPRTPIPPSAKISSPPSRQVVLKSPRLSRITRTLRSLICFLHILIYPASNIVSRQCQYSHKQQSWHHSACASAVAWHGRSAPHPHRAMWQRLSVCADTGGAWLTGIIQHFRFCINRSSCLVHNLTESSGRHLVIRTARCHFLRASCSRHYVHTASSVDAAQCHGRMTCLGSVSCSFRSGPSECPAITWLRLGGSMLCHVLHSGTRPGSPPDFAC